MFATWIRRFFNRKKTPVVTNRRRPSYTLQMERLEDRLTPTGGIWSTGASMLQPQSGVGGAMNGELYVAGGSIGSGSTTAVEAYNPATSSWASEASDLVSRAAAGGAVINGELYVAGGWINSDSNSSTNQLDAYNPATNQWTQQAPATISRGATAVAAIGTNLYVTGGRASYNVSADYNTLEIYNSLTNTWTTGAPIPVPSEGATAAVLNGEMYVIGGWVRTGPSSAYLANLVQAYDPQSNSWTMEAAMPTALAGAAVVPLNGELYVIGGEANVNGTAVNTVEVYDPLANTWSTGPAMPTAVTGAVGGVINNRIYVAGGNNSSQYPSTLQIFTPQASQTITFTPPVSPISFAPNETATLNATGGASGNPVVFTIDPTSTGAGNIPSGGNVLNVTGAGTFVLDANQAGNGSYSDAPQVQETLVVTPASQTITFNPLTPVDYSTGETVPLSSASASSDLPVSYTVLFGPGSVSGNTLAVTGAGTILIEATQTGNADYAAATPVFQTLTVNPASQTISMSAPGSVTYGTAPIPLSSLAASSTSGLPIAYSVASGPGLISGQYLYVTGAGAVSIDADQPGNSDYLPASTVEQSLVVNPAPLAVTATNVSKTYGQADPTLTFAYTGLVNGDTANFTGALSDSAGSSNAGTYVGAISLGSLAATGNYTITSFAAGTLTINPAPLTVTATYQSKLYDGNSATDPVLTFTYAGLVNGDAAASFTGALSRASGEDVGTYAITQSTLAASGNYTIGTFVPGAFTITPASQAIDFAPLQPVAYSPGITVQLSASASSGLPVSFLVSGPASINGTTLTINEAGAIVVQATQAGNANYNAAAPVEQILVVSKASDAITFGPIPAVGMGTGPITLNATGGGSISPVVYSVLYGPGTISGDQLTPTALGSVLVEATQAGDAKYRSAMPAFQTVQVEYGQTINFTQPTSPIAFTTAPIALSAAASSRLPITFSLVSGPGTISGNKLTVTGIGRIVVEADQAGNTIYGPARPVQRTIVVNPAPQAISFTQPASPIAFTTRPTTLSAIASSGLLVKFSVATGPGTISNNQLTINGVGSIVIDANQSGNADYNAAPQVSRTLVVVKANQTISFAALAPVTYGVAPITLGATASSGLPVSYKVISGPGTVNGTALTVSGAGAILLEATQAGNAEYNAATAVFQYLTVNKATLTVSANNATWTAGQPGQQLAGFTISGLVNGDTQSSLFGMEAALVSCPTVNDNDPLAATYTILVTQGTLKAPANYKLVFQNGTLKVQ